MSQHIVLLAALLASVATHEVDAALLGRAKGPIIHPHGRVAPPLAGRALPSRLRGTGRSAQDLIAAAADEVVAGGKWRASTSAACGYITYALGFALLLLKTLRAFPLVPPSPNSLEWCRSWLWTTVADYYGAALAICGVILSTERPPYSFAWAAGCLFLGTPVCCFYAAFRLLRHGSLRLASNA